MHTVGNFLSTGKGFPNKLKFDLLSVLSTKRQFRSVLYSVLRNLHPMTNGDLCHVTG